MNFLNPSKIAKLLPLKEGMKVADFGCGSGYFSLAIAKLIQPGGTVIALDIWKPSLDSLKFRAKTAGLSNTIKTQWANLEDEHGSHLPNDFCDLVLVSNILFEVEDKNTVIAEARRILKPEGLLVLLEWKADKLPSKEFLHPLRKDDALTLLEKYGFKLERELPLGVTHYGFLTKLINKTK